MSSSFFFLQAETNELNSVFLQALETYSIEKKQQIYVLDRPLGDSKYTYDYSGGLVLLIPNYKIIFIGFGDSVEDFDEYVEDFIEDLGSISDKFRYRKIIGRPRSWKKELIVNIRHDDSINSISTFLKKYKISNGEKRKKCELLISLLTGSINDIDKVKGDVPDNILDKIKRKILLFDGDQTRFVYQNNTSKRITIQGLSGTGKTELLLHKLKDIYVENPKSKVLFTCHNKILADNLKNRIPDFFNFMKVEEQIKWNVRLWCVNAWGSQFTPNSGTYSYICKHYGIQFYRYSYTTSFDKVCKNALEDISELNFDDYGFAFDFVLIDESQDFPDSFFQLCERVTKNTVYVAGDIFQSIFDDSIISEIKPDFLLSKCYRTDPKTLMFAHALGMGLFETPKLRWLEDKEWKACGYIVNKNDNEYALTREPLRRFEDLENENYNSIELIKTTKDKNEDAETKIIEIIHSIKKENPTVLADDIAVIFIDSSKNTYLSADRLEQSIPREFGWEVNKAYQSKEKITDTLFVSNKNNVKGLEFPFVICVTKKINNSRNYRNALYMMITRSFLKTFLLISKDSNLDLSDEIDKGLYEIRKNGCIKLQSPSKLERDKIKTTIKYNNKSIPFYDFVHSIFNDLDIPLKYRKKLYNSVKSIFGDNFDYDDVRELIEFNFEKMEGSKS